MHRLSASFVLGYHGCTESTAEKLLNNEAFKKSENDYDWLGPGIYFWEANPVRGLEFFSSLSRRRDISERGTVVGAAIDLGHCLDATSSSGVLALTKAYELYKHMSSSGRSPMPRNSAGSDLLLRRLDCAVVSHLHRIVAVAKGEPFQTVRGLFREGDPIYENSGFYERSHLQICVVDPSCIKGVFRVPPHQLKPPTIPD